MHSAHALVFQTGRILAACWTPMVIVQPCGVLEHLVPAGVCPLVDIGVVAQPKPLACLRAQALLFLFVCVCVCVCSFEEPRMSDRRAQTGSNANAQAAMGVCGVTNAHGEPTHSYLQRGHRFPLWVTVRLQGSNSTAGRR